jgi:uncharacterized protein (UPF0179 family)
MVKMFQVNQKVKCINAGQTAALTLGKIYQILEIKDKTIKVTNDFEVPYEYDRTLFASRKSSKHIATVSLDRTKKVTKYLPPPAKPFEMTIGQELICLDDSDRDNLTEGSRYRVHAINKNEQLVDIIADDDTIWSVKLDRFAVVKKKEVVTYTYGASNTTVSNVVTVIPKDTTSATANFYIGQEVVCVNSKSVEAQFTEGKTYKITEIMTFAQGGIYLKLVGDNGLVAIADPKRFMSALLYSLKKKED